MRVRPLLRDWESVLTAAGGPTLHHQDCSSLVKVILFPLLEDDVRYEKALRYDDVICTHNYRLKNEARRTLVFVETSTAGHRGYRAPCQYVNEMRNVGRDAACSIGHLPHDM